MTRSEAKEEAKRLTNLVAREIDFRTKECDCDEWPYCETCAGSGVYYEFFYVLCDHVVQDGPDEECIENFCAEREMARRKLEASEIEEMEYAL